MDVVIVASLFLQPSHGEDPWAKIVLLRNNVYARRRTCKAVNVNRSQRKASHSTSAAVGVTKRRAVTKPDSQRAWTLTVLVALPLYSSQALELLV